MAVDPDGTSMMLMKFNNMWTSVLKKVRSRWKPPAGQRKASRLLVRTALSRSDVLIFNLLLIDRHYESARDRCCMEPEDRKAAL